MCIFPMVIGIFLLVVTLFLKGEIKQTKVQNKHKNIVNYIL